MDIKSIFNNTLFAEYTNDVEHIGKRSYRKAKNQMGYLRKSNLYYASQMLSEFPKPQECYSSKDISELKKTKKYEILVVDKKRFIIDRTQELLYSMPEEWKEKEIKSLLEINMFEDNYEQDIKKGSLSLVFNDNGGDDLFGDGDHKKALDRRQELSILSKDELNILFNRIAETVIKSLKDRISKDVDGINISIGSSEYKKDIMDCVNILFDSNTSAEEKLNAKSKLGKIFLILKSQNELFDPPAFLYSIANSNDLKELENSLESALKNEFNYRWFENRAKRHKFLKKNKVGICFRGMSFYDQNMTPNDVANSVFNSGNLGRPDIKLFDYWWATDEFITVRFTNQESRDDRKYIEDERNRLTISYTGPDVRRSTGNTVSIGNCLSTSLPYLESSKNILFVLFPDKNDMVGNPSNNKGLDDGELNISVVNPENIAFSIRRDNKKFNILFNPNFRGRILYMGEEINIEIMQKITNSYSNNYLAFINKLSIVRDGEEWLLKNNTHKSAVEYKEVENESVDSLNSTKKSLRELAEAINNEDIKEKLLRFIDTIGTNFTNVDINKGLRDILIEVVEDNRNNFKKLALVFLVDFKNEIDVNKKLYEIVLNYELYKEDEIADILLELSENSYFNDPKQLVDCLLSYNLTNGQRIRLFYSLNNSRDLDSLSVSKINKIIGSDLDFSCASKEEFENFISILIQYNFGKFVNGINFDRIKVNTEQLAILLEEGLRDFTNMRIVGDMRHALEAMEKAKQKKSKKTKSLPLSVDLHYTDLTDVDNISKISNTSMIKSAKVAPKQFRELLDAGFNDFSNLILTGDYSGFDFGKNKISGVDLTNAKGLENATITEQSFSDDIYSQIKVGKEQFEAIKGHGVTDFRGFSFVGNFKNADIRNIKISSFALEQLIKNHASNFKETKVEAVKTEKIVKVDGNKDKRITVLEIPIDENLEDIEISEEILKKLPERKQKEYKEYLKLKKEEEPLRSEAEYQEPRPVTPQTTPAVGTCLPPISHASPRFSKLKNRQTTKNNPVGFSISDLSLRSEAEYQEPGRVTPQATPAAEASHASPRFSKLKNRQTTKDSPVKVSENKRKVYINSRFIDKFVPLSISGTNKPGFSNSTVRKRQGANIIRPCL